MKRAFLVARQEFIKYVTRRGFAISILMFPLWIMIVILVPKWMDGPPTARLFTVVDQSGGAYGKALIQAWLAANRHGAVGSYFIWPPDGLVSTQPENMPDAAEYYLSDAYHVYDHGQRTHLSAIVVIPPPFSPANPHAVYYQRDGGTGLKESIAAVLTDTLRHKSLLALAPQIADAPSLQVYADLTSVEAGSRGNSGLDSIVPIALAIILFVVSVMNASVLLQGVVEEKSTRMIEVLLSCATPREITSGKLIGVIAVALLTLAIWGLTLLVLMTIASHETAQMVFASLRATASLETLPLLLVFFLCGLLIYGSIFLAIGSMANSLADAQALLGPSMLILMLPNVMIAGVMRDPNGTLASTLSWVPIYTPFFMMLRIASHPPVWQLWGTLLLAVTTTALLIWWTGRVFARHVLTTERPPSLGALIQRTIAALTGRRT